MTQAYTYKTHTPIEHLFKTEIMKEPKDFIGSKVEYHRSSQMIWASGSDNGAELLLNVRGWGSIKNQFETYEETADFQDKLGHWIAEAINEKLKRENNDNI